MVFRSYSIGVVALLMGALASSGCCKGGSSSEGAAAEPAGGAAAAKVGERFKGPASDFSVVVEKALVTDAIGDTKPVTAGQRWVIVYFKLKNDGTEAKSYLLEFKQTLKDASGAKYESSTDGAIALAIAEPDASKGSLDKVPVGTELQETVVFAVPADKAKGSLDVVFEEAISLTTPKTVSVSVAVAEKPAAAGAKPAGTAKPNAH